MYSNLAVETLDVWKAWNKKILQLTEKNTARFLDDDLELIRLSRGFRINDETSLVAAELANLEGFNVPGLRGTQYSINFKRDMLRAKLTGRGEIFNVFEDLKRKRNKVLTISVTFGSIGRIVKAGKLCC